MASMKGQMKDITRKQRLASVGSFVVLFVLMLCSIGTTFVIRQTTSQASEATTMNDLYQETRGQILFESLSLQEYILQPSPTNRRTFLVSYQQSLATIKKIAKVGDAEDIAELQPIIVEQNRLLTATKHLFALADAHDTVHLTIFNNTTVEPLLSTIDQQIEKDVTLNHNLAIQKITQMQIVLQLVFTTIILAFAFGIALISLFLGILHHYQRQQYIIEQTEQDMQRVADVQMHLLPREIPTVVGLEIYALSHPAREVGGDFYTFDRHTSGQWVLTIGDVSGKGLQAALLMAIVRTIVHITVHTLLEPEPKVIISKINEYLYDDFTEVGMFSTMFVACYDPATQHLTYTNAGHSPVIYCPAGGSAYFLNADAPMIGVLPMLSTKNNVIPLTPGDILVMATDGLSEAHNVGGEMFGNERLLTHVESLRQEPAQALAEALFETVNNFAAACEQFDDQTIVTMKGITR